jgi:hypothetical protein
MQQLRVRLPIMDKILGLCSEAESWKLQCEEYLGSSTKFKVCLLVILFVLKSRITISIPDRFSLSGTNCDSIFFLVQFLDLICAYFSGTK